MAAAKPADPISPTSPVTWKTTTDDNDNMIHIDRGTKPGEWSRRHNAGRAERDKCPYCRAEKAAAEED